MKKFCIPLAVIAVIIVSWFGLWLISESTSTILGNIPTSSITKDGSSLEWDTVKTPGMPSQIGISRDQYLLGCSGYLGFSDGLLSLDIDTIPLNNATRIIGRVNDVSMVQLENTSSVFRGKRLTEMLKYYHGSYATVIANGNIVWPEVGQDDYHLILVRATVVIHSLPPKK